MGVRQQKLGESRVAIATVRDALTVPSILKVLQFGYFAPDVNLRVHVIADGVTPAISRNV